MTTTDPGRIAVYGSLMTGMGGREELGVTDQLRFVERCEIRGQLFDLGEYPGLVLGAGVALGELYEIADSAVLQRLDKYERYDPEHPEGSLYIRRIVRLERPDCDAWVYEFNRSLDGRPVVPSGDWKRYYGDATSKVRIE